jgi:hypothetical protein
MGVTHAEPGALYPAERWHIMDMTDNNAFYYVWCYTKHGRKWQWDWIMRTVFIEEAERCLHIHESMGKRAYITTVPIKKEA